MVTRFSSVQARSVRGWVITEPTPVLTPSLGLSALHVSSRPASGGRSLYLSGGSDAAYPVHVRRAGVSVGSSTGDTWLP